ncbi:peptidase M16 [Sphingomonas oleivorans]|uniref:Peptidase M16 n=1 Tax=Sphingomonas oleivorans TaxID=1735121 RepID=A0A2T5FVC1_9SPHN|nr:pitrilysin family protein [Sphingomonas oleivorans]PTQ09387.1 peptidase M16 [Sphingomonas oleivorans]
MRSILLRSLVSGLMLYAVAGKAPAAPAASAVAPIAYQSRTLANGLRIYSIPDKSTANVAVQVWYDVGGKDDPAGRSGFAHMFEHLMFKATRNMVPEQMDRLTEDVGGYNNASTGDDYTNYYEVVPANHLQRLLWAEAERMGALVVEPGVFASERDVVKEELRSGEARPYGRLFQTYFPRTTYATHPYARGVIGSIAELDAATIDDIRAFHATYYRPDNAVLVVSGNFDQAQLDKWVDQYFGPIARPNRPIPRVSVAEPTRAGPRSYTVYEPNTPLPAVLISWLIPPARSADNAALTVLDAILSGGESSRLYQSLVYRDQIAQQASTILDDKQGTGAFGALAIMAGGKRAEEGEAALRREVARLRDAPVTDAELAEAKNGLLTAALAERETAEGKASAIATAVLIEGDAKAADREIQEIAAVTAADVQRVARIYLADERRVVVHYLPEEERPAGKDGDRIAIASTVKTAPLAVPPGVASVTPAPAAERINPPAPATPVPVTVPTPIERRLPNGLRLVVVEKRDLPLVSAELVVGGGAAADPASRAGLAELTATLMTKGTATRSATQIAEAIEALGGSIGSGAGWDGSTLSLTVKSDQLAPALGVFADVAQNPAFAEEELERARIQAIDEVGIALKNPARLARMVAARAVYGDTPYGHPAGGTPASLKAITRADVQSAYRAGWRPEDATLILVGDISADRATELATKLFGGWKASPAPAVRPAVTALPTRPRVIVVDLPGAAQAAVTVARATIARSDPRYYPAIVANTTLGGGFSSRLNQEIRIKRGLAYGAGSSIDPRRSVGPIAASTQTKNPTAPEVIDLIVGEMRRLGAEPVPVTELATRKAVLNGGFGREIETTAGLAERLADLASEGVALSELGRYSAQVEAVTPDAVAAVAKSLFDPSAASIVVVGDADQFMPQLQAKGVKAELIPADALKLDGAALK